MYPPKPPHTQFSPHLSVHVQRGFHQIGFLPDVAIAAMADRSRFGHAAMLMFEHALECRGGIDLRSGDPRGGVDLLVEAKAWT